MVCLRALQKTAQIIFPAEPLKVICSPFNVCLHWLQFKEHFNAFRQVTHVFSAVKPVHVSSQVLPTSSEQVQLHSGTGCPTRTKADVRIVRRGHEAFPMRAVPTVSGGFPAIILPLLRTPVFSLSVVSVTSVAMPPPAFPSKRNMDADINRSMA